MSTIRSVPQSEYLLALINDVLDMNKLDFEEIKLTEESVYLREMLEKCLDILEPRAAEHGLQLTMPGLKHLNHHGYLPANCICVRSL